MSSTQLGADAAAEPAGVAAIPARFEVTRLPVTDFDRAKAFYQRLDWRLDIEFKPDGEHRALQFTPPGSTASIQFGEGGPAGQTPVTGSILVVDDIETARDDMIARGAEVGEIWHLEIGQGKVPGVDPQRQSYASRADFSDPEGNGWQIQEVTERLPGRVGLIDVSGLAELLHETSERHEAFETAAPAHDWWDWYAAYLDARQRGTTPDEASAVADRYMAEVKHVVAAS